MSRKLLLLFTLLAGTSGIAAMDNVVEVGSVADQVTSAFRTIKDMPIRDKIGCAIALKAGYDTVQEFAGPMSPSESLGAAMAAGVAGYAAYKGYQSLSDKNKIRVMTAAGIGLVASNFAISDKTKRLATIYLSIKTERALAQYLESDGPQVRDAFHGLNCLFYLKLLTLGYFAREACIAKDYEQGFDLSKTICWESIDFPLLTEHLLTGVVLPLVTVVNVLQDRGFVGYDEDGMRLGRR